MQKLSLKSLTHLSSVRPSTLLDAARPMWPPLPETRLRLVTHLALLGLITLLALSGRFHLSNRPLKVPTYLPSGSTTQTAAQPRAERPLSLPGILQNRTTGLLSPVAVPHTIIPDREVKVDRIETYIVQPGDTIHGIALNFDLAPDTLLWANSRLEDNPDLLMVGDELTILPVDGVYHQVGQDDTLTDIAATFQVDEQTIIDYPLNNLDPENPAVTPGQWLVVPGGEKPYVPKYVSVAHSDAPSDAATGTGTFQWPTNGTITQEYWRGHRALDIAAWMGAPIYAADGGYVVAAQWDDTGYGRMIIVDHGNGFKSLYAHMSVLYVAVGDEVTQGQQLGEMGSSGNSTGPHLHFELILNGVKRNPWGFLP